MRVRPLVTVALAAAGAVLALATPSQAAPAQADGPPVRPTFTVQISPTCHDDGSTTLTWSVSSSFAVRITSVQQLFPGGGGSDPADLSGLVIPSTGLLTFDHFYGYGALQSVAHLNVFYVPVDGSSTTPDLAVLTQRFEAPCVKFAPQCDGTVDITLGNYSLAPDFEGPTRYTINGVRNGISGGPPKVVRAVAPNPDGTIEVTVNSKPFTTYHYLRPNTCPTLPSPPAEAIALPTTGAGLTGLITVGAVLVIAGIALVTIGLRRRRTA